MAAPSNTHVVFIHLDLGIGGAESLVLNLAKATLLPDDASSSSTSAADTASSIGSISIYTTHCSPTHCYDEVRPPNGLLSSHVHVRGSWIPRNFYLVGGGTAFCSALRMLYLTYIASKENPTANVIVIDVLPTGVPYLVECCNVNAGVVFYCHFPDKLLTRDTVNGLYRWVMDAIEEWSMSHSDLIVVNSLFTRGEVEKVFPSLFLHRERVRVLYPSIESSLSRQRKMNTNNGVAATESSSPSSSGPIVSLNRFERKKNIALVIHAYDALLDRFNNKESASKTLLLPPLIIAGGYDPLNVENVEYFAELRTLADATNGPCIIFLPSISDAKRTTLLSTASVWCYTPHREHFGIVPLEAMDAGVPVVAIRSGGPMETIVDGVTGYLVYFSPDGFANAIDKLLSNPSAAKAMGQRGRERVDEAFGMETFRRQWWELLSEARDRGSRRHRRGCTSYPSLIWSSVRTVGDLGWAVLLALFITWAMKCFGTSWYSSAV
ncbi:hypothetical protein ACHAXH_006794 [Discostella pseudostelligera]